MAKLVLQTGGIVLAALVVARLRAQRDSGGGDLASAAILVCAVILAGVALGNIRNDLDAAGAGANYKGPKLSECQREAASLGPLPIRDLQRRIPRDAHFVIFMPRTPTDRWGAMCLDLLMLPRVEVDVADPGTWVIALRTSRARAAAHFRRPAADVVPVRPGVLLIRPVTSGR